MGAMPSQVTSRAIVYSTIYSGADQRKYQSPALLAFVRGIRRSPMNPHPLHPRASNAGFDVYLWLQTPEWKLSFRLHQVT